MYHEKRLRELEKERLQSSTEQEWIRLTIVINRQIEIMELFKKKLPRKK